MNGQGRDNQVERGIWKGVLQPRGAKVCSHRKVSPCLLQHRFALVDADERRSRMVLQHSPRRLPRPRPQLEDSPCPDAARGVRDCVLKLVESLDLRTNRLEVAVGREVKLAQRSSPGSNENMTESRRRPSRWTRWERSTPSRWKPVFSATF
jgi:hypothetical protein